MYLIPVLAIIALVMWRRISATKRPIKGSGVRFLLPLLFICFGFTMFTNPQLNVSLHFTEILVSLAVGVVMSIPLILTTNYEVRSDGNIYAKKSVAFIVSLVVLVALRMALRAYLHQFDSMTLYAMFYLVAVGYVAPWRIASFVKYRMIRQNRAAETPAETSAVS